MWSTRIDDLDSGKTHRVALLQDDVAVTYRDVIKLWQDDESFRAFFIGSLMNAPFEAYRWETPPLTRNSASRNFEFVLVDSPELDRTPDARPFADYLRPAAGDMSVVSFTNLGKDAVLVVPRHVGDIDAYGHIASFIRKAPLQQKHELWKVVGDAMAARVGKQPVWLSTAGMGVPWLHVRLDSRPKYYAHRPYTTL